MAIRMQQSMRLTARSEAVSCLSRKTVLPSLPAAAQPAGLHRSEACRFAQPAPLAQRRSKVGGAKPIAATEANFDEGISGTDDYAPLIAVVGFVAVWFNKLSVDRVKLLQGLAALQLFVTAINLITGRGIGDKVSNVIGPAVLAAAVLSIKHVTYLDVATGLFGYFLSQNLEDITGIPFYGFLATLAVALYLNYGTLWYVAFFGIAAAARVYNSTKNDSKVPVIVLPAIAASAIAIYKEAHFPLALSIFLAQTAWSALKAVDALTKRVKD